MDLRNLTDEELLTVAQGVADDTANPVIAELVKRFGKALDDLLEAENEIVGLGKNLDKAADKIEHLMEQVEEDMRDGPNPALVDIPDQIEGD